MIFSWQYNMASYMGYYYRRMPGPPPTEDPDTNAPPHGAPSYLILDVVGLPILGETMQCQRHRFPPTFSNTQSICIRGFMAPFWGGVTFFVVVGSHGANTVCSALCVRTVCIVSYPCRADHHR